MKYHRILLYLLLIPGLSVFMPFNILAQTTPKAVKVPDEILESYTGRYALTPDFFLEVSKVGDTLKVSQRGHVPLAFFPSSPTRFFNTQYPEITMEFIKADGKVRKVLLVRGGNVIEAVRIERKSSYIPMRK